MDFGMKLQKTVLKFGIKGWLQQHGILKQKKIRFLSFLFFSLFFLISEEREILLPQTPVSAYEDTESSVTAQLPALDENDREFSLSLSLMATASNHLEVAFGLDKNRDGELSLDESELSIGWSCGKWFFSDRRSDATDVTDADGGEKSLVWRIRLNGERKAKRAIAFADSQEVLADAMEKCRSSYFNPQWNMVRVTSCGIDCLSENVKIVSTADGLSIRVR